MPKRKEDEAQVVATAPAETSKKKKEAVVEPQGEPLGGPQESVAGLLRASRQAAGMAQADLGEHAGRNQSWVSKMENQADFNPTVRTLTEVFTAMGAKASITVVTKNDAGEEVETTYTLTR